MAASDCTPFPAAAQAHRLYFAMRSTTGTLITSWTGADSEISKDGASFADCTNEAVEIGTSGVGYIDLTSLEMTGATCIVYKLTVTNANAVPLVVPIPIHNGAKWFAAADAVWDEPYSQHHIAGSFGKLLDTIRKANLGYEALVDPSPLNNQLRFVSNLALGPDGAFTSCVVVFLSGDNTNLNSIITGYDSATQAITVAEPFPYTPVDSDEFIIIAGSHVHSLESIANKVRATGVGVRAAQADDGTISVYNESSYDDLHHDRLSFVVAKDYTSAAGQFVFTVYDRNNTETTYFSQSATVISASLIKVDSIFFSMLSSFFENDPLCFQARYSLRWVDGDEKETIATGDFFIFDQP